MGSETITRRRLINWAVKGAALGPILALLNATETKAGSGDEKIRRNLSYYRDSALKNLVFYPDGKAVIFPSQAYGGDFYGRDAFYAAIGLGDDHLSEEFCHLLGENQDPVTGKIYTAARVYTQDNPFKNTDDETTLLYLAWSGLMAADGKRINDNLIKRAYHFIQSHVENGLYHSEPGNYRYWADTFVVPGLDVIAYNQGLYVIALKFLQKVGMEGIAPAMIFKAEQGYLNLYQKDLGFVAQTINLPYQDASALFPEVLHRYFFDSALMPDDLVLKTVEHRLATAGVYFPDGSLAGLKVIAEKNGDFLPPSRFSEPLLASPGDYQNGGYWPMWSLAELALAYKISRDSRYRKIFSHLLNFEVGHDGSAKEFICLSPDGLGWYVPERTNYSWNVLVDPIARWAGIVRRGCEPSTPLGRTTSPLRLRNL